MKIIVLLFFLGCSSESMGTLSQSLDANHHDSFLSIDSISSNEIKNDQNDVAIVDDASDESNSVEISQDVSSVDIIQTKDTFYLEVNVKQEVKQQDVLQPCSSPPGICDDCKSCTDESGWTGVCMYAENNSKCDDGNSATVDKCNPQAPGSNQITGCVHY